MSGFTRQRNASTKGRAVRKNRAERRDARQVLAGLDVEQIDTMVCLQPKGRAIWESW